MQQVFTNASSTALRYSTSAHAPTSITKQDTAWDEALLAGYLATLPSLEKKPLVVAGLMFGPFLLFSAGVLRFMFDNEAKNWNMCKIDFMRCLRLGNRACGYFGYSKLQYNNDHVSPD